MKRFEENKTSLIGELRHRYHILRIIEIALISIQVMGLISCALFILSNFYEWDIGDFTINTGYYIFVLKGDYLRPVCVVLSILLLIPRPKGLRDKINVLYQALRYLTRKQNLSTQEVNMIKIAKTYIIDVDRAHQKKKEGCKEDIKPHEKRMVVRKGMIVFGIPGISVLSILLLSIFGCNFPQIAAIDMSIGYAMVLVEYAYYQQQLKNAHISVMMDEHKKIIKPVSIQEEQFQFYQKVCYMEADRYSNYCLVLGVASSVLNILAILLTLLDASGNNDLKRLFAIDSVNVNAEISVLFMGVSIIFFLADVIFNFYYGPKIIELNAKEKMEYSTENYKSMEEDFANKIKGNDTFLHNLFGTAIGELLFKPFRPVNTIFSRNALDIGRGKYDYNNDALVEGKNEIPAACMSTVEDSFPGRVPRFKLTALVIWLFLFCFIVWAKKDIKNLIPITFVSVVFYDFILLFFANRTWNGRRDWLLFENEMEDMIGHRLSREVKWDFLSSLLGHSFLLIVLACARSLLMNNYVEKVALIGFIFLSALISLIGYRLAKKKSLLPVSSKLTKIGTFAIMAAGGVCFLTEKDFNIFKLLFPVLIIPGFIEILAEYFRRIENDINKIPIEIPFCAIFLLINWIGAFVVMFCWKGAQGDSISLCFSWLYVLLVIEMIGILLWGLKNMFDQK